MALQNTDLLVVGRGSTSYHYRYDNVKTDITTGLASTSYVDSSVNGLASISYVDTQVGLSTYGLASVAYVDTAISNISIADTTGLASIIYVDSTVASAVSGLAQQSALQQEVADRSAADVGIRSDLQAEIDARTAADVGISSDISDEAARALAAETALGTRIDTLILDDLSDVSVGGASTGQAVTWSGTEWIASTVTSPGALVFQGSIDLTTTAPSVTGADVGKLYVNTGVGPVDNSFGTGVTNSVTNAVGDELVSVTSTGTWSYVGTVGASGLTYNSFSAANVTETTGSKGELAYNNVTGQYTFTKVDLGSRIPMDISTLSTLP